MTVTSLMTNLYSTDVERAAAFYRDHLGGKQTFRYPAEGSAEHVEIGLGDVTIAITNIDAVREEGLNPLPGHPMELVLWCESADEVLNALRAADTPVLVEPYSGHASGLRRAYVADPDGNWIAVVSKERQASRRSEAVE